MSSALEINSKRLSADLLDEICNAYPRDVQAGKVIANEPVLIRGKSFSSLQIIASKFNDTLTFIDCRFTGDLVLKELRAGAVSFINCEFGRDLTVFGTTASVSISLVGSRIAGRLSLDGVTTPKFDVQTLSATDLSITANEVHASIECLSLDRISIANSIQLDSIAGIKQMDFTDLGASMLLMRHIGLQQGTRLCIQNARLGEVYLNDMKMEGAELKLASVTSENFYLQKSTLAQSRLVFEHVLANGLFAIKQCSYQASSIDISSVICPHLELDQVLLDFVTPGLQQESAIFSSLMPEENRLQTLKLLKDKFSREHRYDLEDDVFYILKNFEARHRIKGTKWWKQPAVRTAYFLNRYVMGWGVRLRNPLVSALLIVLSCALMYYFMLNLHDAGKSIQYIGQQVHGFYGATIFSLLAFFGQHADAQITGNAQIALALGEFILGVAMTTIIVGILIRKLVR